MSSSSSNQLTLKERAQQGDCAAIAQLINRAFHKDAVQAEVRAQGKELVVTLQAKTAPQQKPYVQRLVQGLQQLSISKFTHLTVEGYAVDLLLPIWVETLCIQAPASPANKPAQQSASMEQWQGFRKILPPPLRSSAVLIGLMVATFVLFVLSPLATISALLVIAGWGWPRLRHQRQTWPQQLRNLPDDFWLFRWGWILTLLMGFALLSQRQILAYPVLLSLLMLWGKGLYSLLIRHRVGHEDICLMGSLHLLFALIALQLGFSVMEPASYPQALIGVGAILISTVGALGRAKASVIGVILIFLTAILLCLTVFLTVFLHLAQELGDWLIIYSIILFIPAMLLLLLLGLPLALLCSGLSAVVVGLALPSTPYPAARGCLTLVGVYASWIAIYTNWGIGWISIYKDLWITLLA